MGKNLTIEDVQKAYDIIKSDIKNSISRGKIERSFELLDQYAIICQGINDHFRDDEIESYLKQISSIILPVATLNGNVREKSIVFYDQIGTTVCLGLQYLRALVDLGYDITYVFESPIRHAKEVLLNEVKSCCKSYYIFEGKSTVEKAKEIQRIILESGSSKLITHFSAEGALAACVLYSLSGIERYRIVPGDHHYHMGIDCYEHYFDYRDFAIKVSVEERKVPMTKVHRLTYYPIIDSQEPFKGFPGQTKNNVVILAAGAEYKFHGSSWFFDFSKWLLNNNEHTVIVFLGGESLQLRKYVCDNQFENRFLLLGYRTDFVECMKHSDIFLNSYPMGGGLVGLTAVNLGIPVLSHYDEYNGLQNSIRSFMGAEDVDSPISFYDDNKMKEYATRLINDNDFRKQEGVRVKEMTQTRSRFTNQLGEVLENNSYVVRTITNKSCNLDKRTESYLALQNQFQASILLCLFKAYGFYFLIHFPYLLGYEIKNKRFVLGFLLGGLAQRLLPDSMYNKLKDRYMKRFV